MVQTENSNGYDQENILLSRRERERRAKMADVLKTQLGIWAREQKVEFEPSLLHRFSHPDAGVLFHRFQQTKAFTRIIEDARSQPEPSDTGDAMSQLSAALFKEIARSIYAAKDRDVNVLSSRYTNGMFGIFKDTVDTRSTNIALATASTSLIVSQDRKPTVQGSLHYFSSTQRLAWLRPIEFTNRADGDSQNHPELFTKPQKVIITVPLGNSEFFSSEMQQNNRISIQEVPFTSFELQRWTRTVMAQQGLQTSSSM